MVCVNPQFFNGSEVPCGRCISCRVNKTREWSLRIYHEACQHKDCCFTTLTYEKEPPNNSLVKRDLQLYIKRLRKALDSPLRYYAVGEYGEKNERPHYHVIFFGVAYDDPNLNDCWPHGFTVSKPYIGLSSGNYVAGYVQKKLYGPKADYLPLRIPPFSLQSKGIGKEWMIQNAEKIKRDLYITVNGNPQRIPRYYRTKLEITKEDLEDGILANAERTREWHLSRLTDSDYLEAIDLATSQSYKEKIANAWSSPETLEAGPIRDWLITTKIHKARRDAALETLQKMKQRKPKL